MTLPLSSIRIDGGTQSRAALNDEVVADYAAIIREGTDFPPVTVFFDGKHHWLADGFHRFHAYRQAGAVEIAAEVRQGTKRDAVLYSVGANVDHGLRRTNADKRSAVMVLLNDPEWSKESDQWIAERCGVGRAFVVKVRSEANLSSDDKLATPPVTRLVRRRDGRTYEMNVARIGSQAHKQRPLTQPEAALVSLARGETVYLLSGYGRVKVGWSRHGARQRVEQLLTGMPLATVVAVASGGQAAERRVHDILQCERDAGEWFICSPDDALAAMREAGLAPLTNEDVIAREAQQAERDSLIEAVRAALPPAVQAIETRKAEARAAKADDVAGRDLLETIASLTAEAAELRERAETAERERDAARAELQTFADMKAQYEAGGFEAVIAGKDEEIRVLKTRVAHESAEKVSWMKLAKARGRELKKLGATGDILIDIKTGEVTRG